MIVIGLMSGTSYDAIDAGAADFRIEGDTLVMKPLGMLSGAYSDALRDAIARALPPATTTMQEVCRLDTGIGQAFAEVAWRANAELCGGAAQAVASHGQTMFHWVEGGRVRGTLQLGQPAWIAERTGCTVVSDFRSRDVAAGGQGAPLVSAFDVWWLRGRPGNAVALNLGGIANITAAGGGKGSRGPGKPPVAFDTGPASALIDAAVVRASGGTMHFDRDGALGARGQVHAPLLERLLAEPYFALPAPKTTGKELFHREYLERALAGFEHLDEADIVATLTALTARTVADAVAGCAGTEVIASGGGTRNPTLMAMLRERLGTVALRTSDELGLPSAAKEAYAFAMLGWCTLHGIAGTVASCTGARESTVLGSVTPGRRGLPTTGRLRAAPMALRVEKPGLR
jgi:anhydro-N-acetylmuramic acid kinase